MNAVQNAKFVSITPPAAIVDNASFTTAAIDTLGFDFATIVVYFGAMDIAMTALKVQECATSGGSYTDITGANFSGGTDTAGSTTSLPSATSDNTLWIFHIDLRGRQRYLDLVATGGDGATGTYMSAHAILSKREYLGSQATSQFASGSVIVV